MRNLIPIVMSAVLLLATNGCSLVGPTPQTGEQFCGDQPQINGKLFFCGTVQGNLQHVPAPNQGFCTSAANGTQLGLVGYVAVTSGGIFDQAYTQAGASDRCAALNPAGSGLKLCNTIIRCTRLP